MKSFRQVYTELGENRTTVQYWIDKILCRPKQDEKDNTPLQFTPEEVRQLWVIKLYRELGYSNAEIRAIINGEDFDFDKAYDEHIDKLRREKERLEKMIGVASFMKKSSIMPDTIGMDFFKGSIDCDDAISILNGLSRSEKNVICPSDKTFDTIDRIFSRLATLFKKDVPHDFPEAQKLVKELQEEMVEYVGNYTYTFGWILSDFLSNPSEKNRIDNQLCPGASSYILASVLHFCNNFKTEDDEKIIAILESLVQLFSKGTPCDDDSVQGILDTLNQIIKPVTRSDAPLQRLLEICESEVWTKLFNKVQLDGFPNFLKGCVECYYK